MKKYIFLSAMIAISLGALNAQVLSNQTIAPGITGQTPFLDASSNFSLEADAHPNIGKGLVFPTVDLRTFQFIIGDNVSADNQFPTMFNGMVVFNRATGTTLTDGARSSTATDVVPGFYFFFNPQGYTIYRDTGSALTAIRAGVWLPLGGGGNSWDVGGNLKDDAEPQVLGVYENTPDGYAPPIIVWSGVNGVSTPIMHIGRPNGNGTRALKVNLED